MQRARGLGFYLDFKISTRAHRFLPVSIIPTHISYRFIYQDSVANMRRYDRYGQFPICAREDFEIEIEISHARTLHVPTDF